MIQVIHGKKRNIFTGAANYSLLKLCLTQQKNLPLLLLRRFLSKLYLAAMIVSSIN
jgi:hypothetical protein